MSQRARMPKQYPPFTYIPIDIAPIDCPRCGAKAHLIQRSRPADVLAGEMRTFHCKHCDQETKIIAQI